MVPRSVPAGNEWHSTQGSKRPYKANRDARGPIENRAAGIPSHRPAFSVIKESAEEEGFEPSVPRCGTPVFETGPFNHSGTPPKSKPNQTKRLVDRSQRVVRRSRKNRARSAPHSSFRRPAVRFAR